MKEIESFKLDHTQVIAPYIRHAGRLKGPVGDVVCKYDIRLIQPNVGAIPTSSLHTLEHLFAVYSRDYLEEEIIDISPMGCRTGFYLIIFGEKDVVEIQRIVIEILKRIIDTDKIPATTAKECGNYRDHSLFGAKEYAREVLEKYQGKKV
ncbi:S-ribosylhomocysteine lyase [Alkalicella caledoniensis]|uniref:S-ribosylhomocysteine lyase n=1 Tax=Alkalicella caledoniensis TaxID=2731377 RepID=A0A7G9WC62_ALKCA|nr:S-ribosylhomocysteine lyase [Alkalicella caledoniensis]QNO16274.1 S-ribosylhomocysteine lyase [Alkalicella caledoniensis]